MVFAPFTGGLFQGAAMGRPTKYKPEYAEQAAKLCALGATDQDLADFFGASEVTINAWKKKHPEFLKSLKDSKAALDAKVERSLFERATGYSHPEDKIFNDNGSPLVVPTTKHYPPDTTAMIFWLKNRQPKTWRDKVEQSIALSPETAALLAQIQGMSDEQLEALEAQLK